jgi:hypothetical protein
MMKIKESEKRINETSTTTSLLEQRKGRKEQTRTR